jgi:hypothetical protein
MHLCERSRAVCSSTRLRLSFEYICYCYVSCCKTNPGKPSPVSRQLKLLICCAPAGAFFLCSLLIASQPRRNRLVVVTHLPTQLPSTDQVTPPHEPATRNPPAVPQSQLQPPPLRRRARALQLVLGDRQQHAGPDRPRRGRAGAPNLDGPVYAAAGQVEGQVGVRRDAVDYVPVGPDCRDERACL